MRYGVFVAAGADSYGYVSQAQLWSRGQLRVAQPIVRELPAEVSDDLVAPLGYRPARVVGLPGGIVPTYSPGLPMLMAVAARLWGAPAVYSVVPAMAGACIVLVYVFGVRLGGPSAGAAAALLLACSPAFLASAVRPMSDLPVAFWWTLALVSAAGPGPWRSAVAGLATSLAVLTRPNLLPLALVVAVPLVVDGLARSRDRVARLRLGVYGITAVIGPLVVGALNDYLYGAPLRSGYGALADLYALDHVATNLQRYPAWFRETQTSLPLLALAAPLVLRWRAREAETGHGAWTRTRLAWASLALIALTFASYLAYLPFQEWSYLRFLLPAYPALFALFAAGVVHALPAALGTARHLIVLALAITLAAHGLRETRARSFARWQDEERRYVTMGQFVRESLPPNAVVFSMQHSGSVRYYSGRPTLRYDLLEPALLDRVVAALDERGFRPYFLLEDWEVGRFRQQFGRASVWGALDWSPLATPRTVPPVYVYDPRQRDDPRPSSQDPQ